MVANVSNRYENLKKQNKEDGNGAYCQINNFFFPKKKFPMSKSFSGFMAIGWKFMKQIDGTQDWPIYTQKWIRLGKLCLLACLSLVNWKGGVYL